MGVAEGQFGEDCEATGWWKLPGHFWSYKRLLEVGSCKYAQASQPPESEIFVSLKLALTNHRVKPGSGSGRHSPRKNAVVIPGRVTAGRR